MTRHACVNCGGVIVDPDDGPAICDGCFDSGRPDPDTAAERGERAWEAARDREHDLYLEALDEERHPMTGAEKMHAQFRGKGAE